MTTTTKSLKRKRKSDTGSDWLRKPNIQDIGKQLFYQRHIRCHYDSSAAFTPSASLAMEIFGDREVADDYSAYPAYSIICHYHDEPSSLSHAGPDEEFNIIAAKVKRMFHPAAAEEHKLYFHDMCSQGMTVDWKRARQLYRKMLEE